MFRMGVVFPVEIPGYQNWNKCRKNGKYGWVYFYEEEQALNKGLIKTDILQLVDQKLIKSNGYHGGGLR